MEGTDSIFRHIPRESRVRGQCASENIGAPDGVKMIAEVGTPISTLIKNAFFFFKSSIFIISKLYQNMILISSSF